MELTVDEFIRWHESHPTAKKAGFEDGFPTLPRDILEEMVAEGYKLELHDVGNGILSPYIRTPEEASVSV